MKSLKKSILGALLASTLMVHCSSAKETPEETSADTLPSYESTEESSSGLQAPTTEDSTAAGELAAPEIESQSESRATLDSPEVTENESTVEDSEQPSPHSGKSLPSASEEGEWSPQSWEQSRFLDRSGVSPEDIFSGNVIFFKTGDSFNNRFDAIKASNPHLAHAKKLVVGDHFRRPQGHHGVKFGQGSYTVQSGDTLQRIAHRLYGTHQRWVELYFLNPEIQNYDRLVVGMKMSFLDSTQVSDASESEPIQTGRVKHSLPTTEELDEPTLPQHSAPSQPAQPINQAPTQMETARQEQPVQSPPAAPESNVQKIPSPEQTPVQTPVPRLNTQSETPHMTLQKISMFKRLLKVMLVFALMGITLWAIWKFYVQNRQKARARALSLTDEFETYSEVSRTEGVPTRETRFSAEETDPGLHHDTEVNPDQSNKTSV